MALAFCAATSLAAEPSAPVVVGTFPENEADVVRLANGTLKIFYNQRGEYVGSLTSQDDGRTWSAPQKEFAVSGETAHAMQVLLDRRGELQVYWLGIRRGGRKLGVDYFLDLWQATTRDGGRSWNEPRRVHEGAIGALRGIVQTQTGRIVIPFSTAHPKRKAGPPIGYFYTTAVYSDDDGQTWQTSPSQLTATCFEGYNGGNYGAVEPTIVERQDGTLWMLIRTQTGRMYESSSADGREWSEAKPSGLYGSNSPAMLRRLDDGRLLVCWNNAQVPPRHEGQGVYGGRDALHAAISDDDGKTWRGAREVYRDPTRHGQGVELRNDRGTAYPDAVQTKDGAIVLVTGQGEGRRAIIRFRPEWLLETTQTDDFSRGLEQWHAQQEVGPAQRFFRKRREGAQLIPHPDDPKRQVLSIGKRDAEPPAGAVWNFPQTANGELTLRVRAGADFQEATLGLTDRLFLPTDESYKGAASFGIQLATRMVPQKGIQSLALTPHNWHELKFAWSNEGRWQLLIELDGKKMSGLENSNLNLDDLEFGYLYIRSNADNVDRLGLLVERVEFRDTSN
ncbi:MAG: exo-alpha-sialidase [Planctomycetes bacterium]|nr:exo-alpha-sialidase [Planctomycetota bacterium]